MLEIALAGGAIGCTSVLAWWLADARRLDDDVVAIGLSFGPDLDAEAVSGFLGAISGLLPPRRRSWRRPFVSLEVLADHRGIRHRLVTPRSLLRTVEAALAAHLPNVGYTDAESVRYPELTDGHEMAPSTALRPLAVDPEALSKRLLASLQPLRSGEAIVTQVILTPARGNRPARVAGRAEPRRRLVTNDGIMATSEAAAALKRKQSSPPLLACLRLGVRAEGGRARYLLSQVETSWRSANAPGVSIRRRPIPKRTVTRRISHLSVPSGAMPVRLNTLEAAGLASFPIGGQHLPGLRLGGCPPLPLPEAVGRKGICLGEGTHPRTRRRAAWDDSARRHHALIVGKSGSGKTVAATHVGVGAAANRSMAMVAIDPKGGLTEDHAAALPADRLDDVVVIDPASRDHVVGFDPLAASSGDIELVADRILGLMVDIWPELGPRSYDLIRHALLIAATSKELRLTEVLPLLLDAQLRQRVVAKLPDRFGIKAWAAWFDSLSGAERAAMVQAPANKLRSLAGREVIARIVGQDRPAISNFERILAEHKILLVRLPVGQLGPEATSLLAGLVLNQVWNAISARAAIRPERRAPVLIMIDELATVLRFPAISIETLYEQARAFNVGILAAAQTLSQLPASLRSSVLANASTKIMLAGSQADASVFAKEFAGRVTADQLLDLDAYQAVAAIHAAGRTQPPATLALLPPSEPQRQAAEVFARSHQRWGADSVEIDAAIARRATPPEAANQRVVGRRQRGDRR